MKVHLAFRDFPSKFGMSVAMCFYLIAVLSALPDERMTFDPQSILEITDLAIEFDSGKSTASMAVAGVSLFVKKGEVLGIVGESGSGKTVLSSSILRLLPENGRIIRGDIEWGGRSVLSMGRDELKELRGGKIAMIFQDAQAVMNPVFTIGRQMSWVLALHRGIPKKEAREIVIDLLSNVRIAAPEKVFNQYPRQLSGGMCSRVQIAMGISCQPELLIADEPTSALDVTTQAEILDLLEEVKEKIGMSMIFITHDLGVASRMADRVAVMFRGEVVETGTPEAIFTAPKAAYTQKLIESVARTSLPVAMA